jgi:hypothetical protein
MSVADLIQSPQFQKLSIADQHKYLKEKSDVFNSYSPKDQGTILYNAKTASLNQPDYGTTDKPKTPAGGESTPKEDEGFVPTVMSDIGGLLTTNPIDTIKGAFKGQVDEFKKAGDSKNSPLERFGHGLAGVVPLVGPMAASAGEAYGEGRPGEGTARAFEALAPEALKSLPEGSITNPLKGAYEGARDAKITHPFLKGAAGEFLAHSIDPSLKGAGFVTGMMSDKLIGGIKGLFSGPKGSSFETGTLEGPEVKPGLQTGQWQGPEEKPDIVSPFKVNPNLRAKLKVGQSSGKVGDSPKAYKVRRPGVRDDIAPMEPKEGPETPQEGTKTDKAGNKQVLRDVPIEHISGDEGNMIYEDKMSELAKKPNPEPPTLRTGDSGFIIDDGHHRILDAVRKGATSVKAWTPEELPSGHKALLGETN